VKHLFIPLFLLPFLAACAAPSQDSFKIASGEHPGQLHVIPLDSAGVVISLPEAWQAKPEIVQKPGATMYHFRRQAVYDSRGVWIIPNLAGFTENVPPGIDLVEYSVTKRTQQPYSDMRSMKLAWAVPGELGMLCYLAQYDDAAGLAHKVYLVHAMACRGRGIQIVIDGTESVFDMLDPEYKLIINGVRRMR
jgi:hypothetical protein